MAESPEQLLKEMSKVQSMERGKVRVFRSGPNRNYHSHSYWDRKGKKTVTRYVPQDQVEDVQKAIDQYKKFQELVRRYEDLIITRTRTRWGVDQGKEREPTR